MIFSKRKTFRLCSYWNSSQSVSDEKQLASNWMAWCRTNVSDFFGLIFFPSKVPEFLHMLFNLVVKHSPYCFWPSCTLFLRKTRTKYLGVHNERALEQEKTILYILGSFVSTCWCSASDKGASKRWIIFFELVRLCCGNLLFLKQIFAWEAKLGRQWSLLLRTLNFQGATTKLIVLRQKHSIALIVHC